MYIVHRLSFISLFHIEHEPSGIVLHQYVQFYIAICNKRICHSFIEITKCLAPLLTITPISVVQTTNICWICTHGSTCGRFGRTSRSCPWLRHSSPNWLDFANSAPCCWFLKMNVVSAVRFPEPIRWWFVVISELNAALHVCVCGIHKPRRTPLPCWSTWMLSLSVSGRLPWWELLAGDPD